MWKQRSAREPDFNVFFDRCYDERKVILEGVGLLFEDFAFGKLSADILHSLGWDGRHGQALTEHGETIDLTIGHNWFENRGWPYYVFIILLT